MAENLEARVLVPSPLPMGPPSRNPQPAWIISSEQVLQILGVAIGCATEMDAALIVDKYLTETQMARDDRIQLRQLAQSAWRNHNENKKEWAAQLKSAREMWYSPRDNPQVLTTMPKLEDGSSVKPIKNKEVLSWWAQKSIGQRIPCKPDDLQLFVKALGAREVATILTDMGVTPIETKAGPLLIKGLKPETVMKGRKVAPYMAGGTGGGSSGSPSGSLEVWGRRVMEKDEQGTWRVISHVAGLEEEFVPRKKAEHLRAVIAARMGSGGLRLLSGSALQRILHTLNLPHGPEDKQPDAQQPGAKQPEVPPPDAKQPEAPPPEAKQPPPKPIEKSVDTPRPFRVVIDLDDTLLSYSKEMWSARTLGEPLPGAVAALQTLKDLGCYLCIFTARIEWSEDIEMRDKILVRLAACGFPEVEVWMGKDKPKPWADVFIDDKTLGFGPWSDMLPQIIARMRKWQMRDVSPFNEIAGIPVRIEARAGEVRYGRVLPCDYGEIVGTVGADGDPIDVMIGPDWSNFHIYIVAQEDSSYDEDKVMMGFPSPQDALDAWERYYGHEYRPLAITKTDPDGLKDLIHLQSLTVQPGML